MKQTSKFVRAKHAIAVDTATAGLHMSLWAAKVKTGDEVIPPSFTFVAAAEVVAMVRAKPVFADIERSLKCAPLIFLYSGLAKKNIRFQKVYKCNKMSGSEVNHIHLFQIAICR